MSKAETDPVRIYAARTIHRQLRELDKEVGGAAEAEDIESVHRSRVASRRLRASLDIFEDCLPKGRRKGWKREVRQVTRSLGEARDLDVQIEFLRSYIDRSEGDASLHRLLSTLSRKRSAAQEGVVRAIEELDESGTLKDMESWAEDTDRGQAIDLGPVRTRARDSILAMIEEVKAYDLFVGDPGAIVKHHEMRIAGKHLRYTAEIFSKGYEDGLKEHIKHLKDMQEMLGEMHDCDVWSELLVKRKGAGAHRLLEDRRARRAKVHSDLVPFWKEMKEEYLPGLQSSLLLPAEKVDGAQGHIGNSEEIVPSAAAIAAGHGHYDDHAKHVQALSRKLFDVLAARLGIEDDAVLLESAAVLHDIGWSLGAKGHHRSSFELIMASDLDSASFKEKLIIANVARYHRGSLPKRSHSNLKGLNGREAERMCILASILRIADGLDYGHRQNAKISDITLDEDRLEIKLADTAGCEEEISSAMKKSDLFTKVTGIKVVIS